MIDTIIYDMGNVLIEWNPEKFLHLIETDEERIAKLRTAIFTSGYWPRQDTGELDADKAYHMSLMLLDDSYQESLRQIYYHWYEYADVFSKMQDYAQELKKQGYKLFVLSNTAASYYDLAKNDYLPIDEILDGKVLSYEVEMVKPDVAIYQYLLDKYGLEAQNCVFLDDIKGNIEAAQSLGMQGIQVLSENQALADLKVLLSKHGRLSEQ